MRSLGILFALLLFSQKHSFSAVFESADSYVASEITVTSHVQDRDEAERELIAKAKISAFMYVQMYIGNEKINSNNVDVESFLVEFSIKNIAATEEGFVGNFVMTFDKSAMDSFSIAETRRTYISDLSSTKPIFVRVDTTRGVASWSGTKRMLKLANINYRVVLIDSDFLELAIFDVENLNSFKRLILKYGYQIFQNNDFLFIKKISIYDDK